MNLLNFLGEKTKFLNTLYSQEVLPTRAYLQFRNTHFINQENIQTQFIMAVQQIIAISTNYIIQHETITL